MEYLKPVIEKLGISSEELTKLEKGELSADDFVSDFIKKSEQSITDRIKTTVETESKSELQRGAYARAEKLVADIYKLDPKKYEAVDNQKKLETMLKDAAVAYDQQLEKLKGEYTSADAKKLQAMQQQLDLLNNTLTEKDNALVELNSTWEQKEKAGERNRIIEKLRDTLIEGVKNSRYEPKIMRIILDDAVVKMGITFELDADGKIWANKEGKRIPNPKRPTENLTYETLFAEIAESNTFIKQSNGSEKTSIILDEKDPNYEINKRIFEHRKAHGHI